MERKEIILRNLIQIAKRYESEHTGLLAWEIPSVRDAEKWLEKLRKPDVIKSVCENCSNTDFNETMGCRNYLQGFKCENFKQTGL
jgi:hypothetical protein